MEKCYGAAESRRPVYSDHGYGVRWLRDHRVLSVCDIRTGPNMNKLIRPIKKFASNPQQPGLFQNDTDFFFLTLQSLASYQLSLMVGIGPHCPYQICSTGGNKHDLCPTIHTPPAKRV